MQSMHVLIYTVKGFLLMDEMKPPSAQKMEIYMDGETIIQIMNSSIEISHVLH